MAAKLLEKEVLNHQEIKELLGENKGVGDTVNADTVNNFKL